jgi:hypothetical protein
MRIKFTHGQVIHVTSAQFKEEHLQILTGHVYNMSTVKSITYEDVPYKDRPRAPTPLQTQLTEYVQRNGYVWDKRHSTAAAAVILKRADGDFWLLGLDGEIMHNPEALLTIQL